MTPIGKMLKDARQAQHMTRAELARLSGLSATTINWLELGKHSPSVDTIEKIANGLGYEARVVLIKKDRV